MVANDAGDRVTPAIVGWGEASGQASKGEVLVGISAKQLAARKPGSVIQASKSVLGLGSNDPGIEAAIDKATKRRTARPNVSTDQVFYEVEIASESGAQIKVNPTEAHTHIYKYMHGKLSD